ncbi:MAG: hypothetical protein ABH854_02095 [Candidatus Diapherotrites archaeon]
MALSFSIAILCSPALMVLGTPASTHLKILEIENPNNLNIEFFDSLRSDDDFVFYEFRLNAAEPLILKKLIVSEERKDNKKEFGAYLSKWGKVIIAPPENSTRQAGAAAGVSVEGEHSFLTSETFLHDYEMRELFFITELTDEYVLNAGYEFEEGTIKVKYLFSDREIHAFWFFFWLLPVCASIILTVLAVLIPRRQLHS